MQVHYHKKTILLLFVFSFCRLLSHAQNSTIDSLNRILKTAKQDTSQVRILNQLSAEYDNNMELDKAISFGNKAFALAKKINNLKGIAKALDNIGNALSDGGKNEEALKNYYTSLEIKKEIGNKEELAYTYNLIGNSATNNEEALKNYLAALKYNLEINAGKAIANNYNNIGLVYFNKGEYLKALKNYFSALKLYKELGNSKGVALVYRNIGACFVFQGNYPEALKNQLASMKINDSLGDKIGLISNYNNIGIVYQYQLNYDEAIKYYSLSLKIAKEANSVSDMANAYINIGNVYIESGNYQEALKNQFLALKINKERNDKPGIALNYINIGLAYKKQGNYSEALKNHFESLKISEELGDKNNMSTNYINIGDIYLKLNNKQEAEKYFKKGLLLAKETGNKFRIKESYNSISLLDSALANWKSAYSNVKMYYIYRDSLINEVNTKKLVQEQMQYEFNKEQDKAKLEQEKKNVIIAEEKHQQRIITVAISFGLLIVIVFSFLLYNRFKLTVRQKEVITLQKIEVENQKEIVEEKNKQVTDSINYAKRIQTALMPSLKSVKENLPQSFIFYLPKDIVAGDFYWVEKVQVTNNNGLQGETIDELILFAACDCTGHGVPGALVSVVCSNALNRAVREFKLIHPDEILNKTEEIVTENFAKNELEIKDGMDVSLCSLNISTGKIEWAGANNPLWFVTKPNPETADYELTEVKADKQPIGINENNHPFTNHEFQLAANDTIYLFSDGYADQFGGETGRKKITRKRFKELILSVQQLSLEEQKLAIETFFFEHKKNIDQIDDILVIGVRV